MIRLATSVVQYGWHKLSLSWPVVLTFEITSKLSIFGRNADLFPISFSYYLKENENKKKNSLQDFLHVTPHCLVSSVNGTNDTRFLTFYICYGDWKWLRVSLTLMFWWYLRLAFVKLERMNNILRPFISIVQRIVLGVYVHLRCLYSHLRYIYSNIYINKVAYASIWCSFINYLNFSSMFSLGIFYEIIVSYVKLYKL